MPDANGSATGGSLDHRHFAVLSYGGVIPGLDAARAGRGIDAGLLGSAVGTRIADLVAFNQQIAGVRLDVEPVTLACIAIIQHLVPTEHVAMAAVGLGLLAKVNAGNTVAGNGVVDKLVVRVLVTDGDAVMAVGLYDITGKARVPHAPAQEQADVAIIVKAAGLHHSVGASGSRVHAVTRMAVRLAVFDTHAIADLEGDAVAVVVPRDTVAHGHVTHAVHVNGAAAAAVDIRILGAIAVDGEALESNVGGILGDENGEGVAQPRVSLLGVVVAQGHGVEDDIRQLHRGDAGDADIPAAVQLVVGNRDAHAGTELRGVGDAQECVAVIGVLHQRALDASALAKDSLTGDATDGHTGGHEEAVVHGPGPRADGQGIARPKHSSGLLKGGAVGPDHVRRAG